ncbi:MAG: hypothetical protein R3188_08320, partial [Acidiferrobacterales bacterium]|nr:hypothetical protein [Acidiferrobacterales bacterium]
EGISIGITAKKCRSAGTTSFEFYSRVIKSFNQQVDIIDTEGDMTVASAADTGFALPGNRFCVDQVDLLSADFKPGTIEAEIRALVAYCQIENISVKMD